MKNIKINKQFLDMALHALHQSPKCSTAADILLLVEYSLNYKLEIEDGVVRHIHDLVANDWKRRIRANVPDAFKPELVIPKGKYNDTYSELLYSFGDESGVPLEILNSDRFGEEYKHRALWLNDKYRVEVIHKDGYGSAIIFKTK